MASAQKVTVDKAYFDALLRRANFHTSSDEIGNVKHADISISKAEYDGLLRTSREYEFLKEALFQGGITSETLDMLISGASYHDHRKDSGASFHPWTDGGKRDSTSTSQTREFSQLSFPAAGHNTDWRGDAQPHTLRPSPTAANNARRDHFPNSAQSHLQMPCSQRQANHGPRRITPSSYPEDDGFDDALSLPDDDANGHEALAANGHGSDNVLRTLYFCGFPESTTYQDLLSVVKGGQLVNVILRSQRSATVSFLDSAAAVNFLTWAKKNDVYIGHKRVDVRWAERHFSLNGHIAHKIQNGATRNFVIHNAREKGLSESQIRDDMEHIHGLVIISVTFRDGNAYVSTNSVHNALFARTCMLSRISYKGCKVAFCRDDCDVPLPRSQRLKNGPVMKPVRKATPMVNRFDMLNMDGTEADSDEENLPAGQSSDDDVSDSASHHGVGLQFCDVETVV